ncbi:DUF6270 domain-containing protein [Pseudomonas monteilii]|uniref:DUF6270 domain-containing protein n=1 Tax=Pseudomonas monteilii TaxID=76759 RepID=UPI0030D59FCB
MKAIHVLIFGSCVSRDVIEFDTDGDIALTNYFARSSMAGVGTAACGRSVSLSEIASAFQKRIVGYELDKTFLQTIETIDFEILLIDLIDERFALAQSADEKTIVTLSNELLKSDFLIAYSDHKKIAAISDDYFSFWERGWAVLVEKLRSIKKLEAVLVNKVFWATEDINGNSLDSMYREGWIEKNNAFLSKMYKRMARNLQPHQFVNFSESELRADPEHKWGVSAFHYTPGVYKKTLNALKNFNRPTDSGLEAEMLAEQLSALQFDENVIVMTIDDSLRSNTLPGLDDFYALISTSKAQEIITAGLEGKSATIISPKSARPMKMLGSTYLASRNFIYFDDMGELAVLVQHHKFCRALYYPTSRLLLKFDTIDLPNSCFDVLHEFCGTRQRQFAQYFSKPEAISSAGLLVSYGRPYHYFYDILPSALTYKDHVKAEHDIITIKGGDFFPSYRLFGKSQGLEFDSEEALSDYLLKCGKVLILSAYPKSRPKDFAQFDSMIVRESLSMVERDTPELVSKLASADGIYWFGLCVEKRVWKEQVQTIREVIADIIKDHENPLFIFDGLTATQDEGSDFKLKHCETELKLLAQVTADLVPERRTVNLIGEKTQNKITCAHYTSLFLTSFLTDSMYVARFCQKPGIGYGAQSAMHTDHVHFDTYFVPSSWVVDDTKGSRNWSEISYSINSELVRAYFNAIRKNSSSRLDLTSLQAKLQSEVSIAADSTGVELSSIGKRHLLSALIPETAKVIRLNGSFEIPSNTSAVVRFLGRADRRLSVSALLSTTDETRVVKNEYVTLGKALHFPAISSARSINVSIRVKGDGTSIIRSLDCTYLPPSSPSNIVEDNDYQSFDINNLEKSIVDMRELPASYECEIGDQKLYFRYIPNGSQNLLVFFHSALTRTENSKMPAFAGNGAIGIVDANILMISDPSITNENNLSLAWYAGSDSFRCQNVIRDLITALSKIAGTRRTVLYGGSGGGFASLYYGRELPDSISVGANPQTNISHYSEASVAAYLDTCFPANKEASVDTRLQQAQIDYHVNRDSQLNTVIYLQNLHDHHHINTHLPYYFGGSSANSETPGGKWIDQQTLIYLSSSWGRGHAAPPRKFAFELLKYLFTEPFQKEELANKMVSLDNANASLVNRVTLRREGEQMVCTISPNIPPEIKSEATFAFYLLENGNRVAYIPYQASAQVTFKPENDGALYQAVGFVRAAGRTSSIKSNKISGSTE